MAHRLHQPRLPQRVRRHRDAAVEARCCRIRFGFSLWANNLLSRKLLTLMAVCRTANWNWAANDGSERRRVQSSQIRLRGSDNRQERRWFDHIACVQVRASIHWRMPAGWKRLCRQISLPRLLLRSLYIQTLVAAKKRFLIFSGSKKMATRTSRNMHLRFRSWSIGVIPTLYRRGQATAVGAKCGS